MTAVSTNLHKTPITGPVEIKDYKGTVLTILSEKDGSTVTFDVSTGEFG